MKARRGTSDADRRTLIWGEPHRAQIDRGGSDKAQSGWAEPALERRVVWLLTPMITGGVGMSLEMAAFRLYAPFLGYSIYVWGGMIAGVMGAMAAGYAAGGRWADRKHADLKLYGLILFSAAYQIVMILAARPLLRWISGFEDAGAALIATLFIFGPPVTALAATIPFVVRLLSRGWPVGSAAGRVYAVSTLGGIAGVLITGFYLVPVWGTAASLKTACAVSAALGVGGLATGISKILPLVVIAALPLLPGAASPANVIWTSESAYNLVRVESAYGRLLLKLNQENSVHTVRGAGGGPTELYYDYFELGPLLAEPHRLLVLGMGAGGSIAATRAIAPNIEIDAVEIDEKVIEAATLFFGLDPRDPKLRIHLADARPWLARTQGLYNIVHLDLYQGGPYIPFYLVTVEFFRMVSSHMATGGVLLMNLFDAGRSSEILRSTVATMAQVFPAVAVVTVGRGNYMIVALNEAETVESIRARLLAAAAGGPGLGIARSAAASIHEGDSSSAGAIIFTDDHAPIEQMTHRMLSEQRRP